MAVTARADQLSPSLSDDEDADTGRFKDSPSRANETNATSATSSSAATTSAGGESIPSVSTCSGRGRFRGRGGARWRGPPPGRAAGAWLRPPLPTPTSMIRPVGMPPMMMPFVPPPAMAMMRPACAPVRPLMAMGPFVPPTMNTPMFPVVISSASTGSSERAVSDGANNPLDDFLGVSRAFRSRCRSRSRSPPRADLSGDGPSERARSNTPVRDEPPAPPAGTADSEPTPTEPTSSSNNEGGGDSSDKRRSRSRSPGSGRSPQAKPSNSADAATAKGQASDGNDAYERDYQRKLLEQRRRREEVMRRKEEGRLRLLEEKRRQREERFFKRISQMMSVPLDDENGSSTGKKASSSAYRVRSFDDKMDWLTKAAEQAVEARKHGATAAQQQPSYLYYDPMTGAVVAPAAAAAATTAAAAAAPATQVHVNPAKLRQLMETNPEIFTMGGVPSARLLAAQQEALAKDPKEMLPTNGEKETQTGKTPSTATPAVSSVDSATGAVVTSNETPVAGPIEAVQGSAGNQTDDELGSISPTELNKLASKISFTISRDLESRSTAVPAEAAVTWPTEEAEPGGTGGALAQYSPSKTSTGPSATSRTGAVVKLNLSASSRRRIVIPPGTGSAASNSAESLSGASDRPADGEQAASRQTVDS